MKSKYKPSDVYDEPFNPNLCKASVPYGDGSVRNHQCQRKATKDGWCHQHHPNAEKARQEKSRQCSKNKATRRAAPYRRVKELQAEIVILQDRVEAAEAEVERLRNLMED